MNQKLLERFICVMSNVQMSRCFWAEALNIVCYLINKSPTTTIDFKTPFEVWYGKTSNYTCLRVFDCPSCYHLRKEN